MSQSCFKKLYSISEKSDVKNYTEYFECIKNNIENSVKKEF